MPTVAWVIGFAIVFFFEDHAPPHFHVRGKGVEAKFELADLALVEIKGTLRPAEIRAIRDWARRHLPALYRAWNMVQDGDAPPRIGG